MWFVKKSYRFAQADAFSTTWTYLDTIGMYEVFWVDEDIGILSRSPMHWQEEYLRVAGSWPGHDNWRKSLWEYKIVFNR